MTTDAILHDRPQPLPLPAAITLTALLLGIAADYLFWPEGPWNAALVAWLLLFCPAVIGFCWYRRMPWRTSVALLAALPVAAALLLLFRATDVLMLATLGIFFAVGLQILLCTAGINFLQARLSHFLRAIPALPLQAGFGVLPVLGDLQIGSNWRNPRTRGVVRGLLIALPLLVLFTALFSSADEGFSRYVPDLGTFFNSDTPAHLMLIVLFFAISGGLLAGVLKTRSLAVIDVPIKLQSEETGVVLGLLSALFVAFVLFQLRYLFGGQETIEATTGLTIANYARRGFFELLWVAVLTLALLLIVAKTTGAAHLLRLFGTVIVLCVLIMLASAVQRMLLYIDSFGLSIDRVVACTVMGWLACCLVLCACTVLVGRDDGFAAGMANLGIAFCFLLILINPAKLVANTNIDRALRQQAALDTLYLYPLADAVPVILERLDELPHRTQCEFAYSLIAQWAPATTQVTDDWRTWNYSRQNAVRSVTEAREKLMALTGRNDEPVFFSLTTGPATPGLWGCE